MKKSPFILLSFFMISSLLLSGCQKLWEWPFGSSDSDYETGYDTSYDDYWSTSPANATGSLNRYTDLINNVHTQIKYLEDNTDYLESSIPDYAEYGYEPYFTCYYDVYDRDALYADVMNPVGLSAEESSDLIAQASAIFTVSDEAERLCKDLGKYVTAQDYKDDNFAAALVLVNNIYTQIDAYYDLHNALLDDIDTLFDSYNTWIVDPTDPISVGIDNMGKDLEKTVAILDLVEVSYMEELLDGKGSDLQSLYDGLSATSNEHRSNAPQMQDDISYYYEDFYTLVDENFLPTSKRALRSIEANDLDALGTDYYDILNTYNMLVDDYNYFLDTSNY